MENLLINKNASLETNSYIKRSQRLRLAGGDRADAFFQNLGISTPKNMQINSNIEFFVNDVSTEGYSIFKKTLNF